MFIHFLNLGFYISLWFNCYYVKEKKNNAVMLFLVFVVIQSAPVFVSLLWRINPLNGHVFPIYMSNKWIPVKLATKDLVLV